MSVATMTSRLATDWDVVPLGLIGSRRSVKNFGMAETNLLSLSYGKIIPKDVKGADGLRPETYETYQIVEPGDIIFRFTDLQNDQRSLRTGLVTQRGIITSAYIAFAPDCRVVDPQYLAMLMRSYDTSKVFYEMGSGVRQTLKFDELSSLRVPLPSLNTQRRIAAFLDRETGEMDAMVVKLDQLIEALHERREETVRGTLISSEAQWANLGLVTTSTSGAGFPHRYQGVEGEDLPFYKVSSLSSLDSSGFVKDDKNSVSRQIARELGASVIPPHSVLMAKIGAALLLGRFVQNQVECCIDNNMLALFPVANVLLPDFLAYSMTLVSMDLLVNPGAVPSLNVAGLRMTKIPLPPIPEQQRIVTHLDRETAETDAMIGRTEKLKSLIAERRSALITDVVSGRKEV
ncbi:restriction endonuclease subunit S [Citricoccus nitrophenolicus]|uniref:restriction endonuclease subunit S n=1 Tax=Citricoccus nitrophenolicus TaxID=863575 RepID=UPI0031EE9466